MSERGTSSSIHVTVRIRPFTNEESDLLQCPPREELFLSDGSFASARRSSLPTSRVQGVGGVRKVLKAADTKMLIFDPNDHMRASDGTSSRSGNRRDGRQFVFDRVFDEGATQEEVYRDTTMPLLDNVMNGINATVFAYGATGCGKTHTISGTREYPGIIHLTMEELFLRIDELRDTNTVNVSLSYLEIYNETIRDLLEPDNGLILSLREDNTKKITVSNLSTRQPDSVDDVMRLIEIGNENRTVSPTEANATSSRSHAVLQINIAQKGRTAGLQEDYMFATLSIIDLAGSERAAATRNSGLRLKEGAKINKSLLALGSCINALCQVKPTRHVPYRDSKLTRLLEFSLGGNCKTVMIVCVSPSSQHAKETLNALKYADRAKRIKTKVMRNEHTVKIHVGEYKDAIRRLENEVNELRASERNAVNEALKKSDDLRIKCDEALRQATHSLDLTFQRTIEQRANLAKCESRLNKITLSKPLIESLLNAIDKNFGPDLKHIEPKIPGISTVRFSMENILKGIDDEVSALKNYLNENSQIFENIITTTIDSLKKNLQNCEGWTSTLSNTFKAYCDLLKVESENRMMKTVINELEPLEPSIFGNMNNISNIFFRTITRIAVIKDLDPTIMSVELASTLHDIINDCSKIFNYLEPGSPRKLQARYSNGNSATYDVSRGIGQIQVNDGEGSFGMSQSYNSKGNYSIDNSNERISLKSRSPIKPREEQKDKKRVRFQDHTNSYNSCSDTSMTFSPESKDYDPQVDNIFDSAGGDSFISPEKEDISMENTTGIEINNDESQIPSLLESGSLSPVAISELSSSSKEKYPHEIHSFVSNNDGDISMLDTSFSLSPASTKSSSFGVKGQLRRKSGGNLIPSKPTRHAASNVITATGEKDHKINLANFNPVVNLGLIKDGPIRKQTASVTEASLIESPNDINSYVK
ncbi:kinesin-domain-containing protein [Nadsonia fulvescens var. elongata DSM 6958]|uniref:Kinesin-like protein n=1 Tax=Nadsonia fulvescens var. elongata DSM 6958 TaxID=857566 RepID=A0A1E3PQ48_9ASCO|nr:kinesin-domain-containing protein [Nadsonia fulvescens var. elongata DSM 6958]